MRMMTEWERIKSDNFSNGKFYFWFHSWSSKYIDGFCFRSAKFAEVKNRILARKQRLHLIDCQLIYFQIDMHEVDRSEAIARIHIFTHANFGFYSHFGRLNVANEIIQVRLKKRTNETKWIWSKRFSYLCFHLSIQCISVKCTHAHTPLSTLAHTHEQMVILPNQVRLKRKSQHQLTFIAYAYTYDCPFIYAYFTLWLHQIYCNNKF